MRAGHVVHSSPTIPVSPSCSPMRSCSSWLSGSAPELKAESTESAEIKLGQACRTHKQKLVEAETTVVTVSRNEINTSKDCKCAIIKGDK